MSTRCNVIIKDQYDELIFYRHSDGYPEGVADTLNQFVQFVRDNKLRDNVEQSAGWLIVLGHEEYYGHNNLARMRASISPPGRKVGAYEPATCIHSDIQYLYEIDLDKKTLRGWKHDGERKGDLVDIPGNFT